LYFAIFGICILIGATAAPDGVWDISDFAIGTLTAINLVVLVLMRREIKEETERFVSLPKK
jgi:Na+/alanine symporter